MKSALTAALFLALTIQVGCKQEEVIQSDPAASVAPQKSEYDCTLMMVKVDYLGVLTPELAKDPKCWIPLESAKLEVTHMSNGLVFLKYSKCPVCRGPDREVPKMSGPECPSPASVAVVKEDIQRWISLEKSPVCRDKLEKLWEDVISWR
jgi:hypothetical protein